MKPIPIVVTALVTAFVIWAGASLWPMTEAVARAAEGEEEAAAAADEGDAAAVEVKPLFGRDCVLHLRRDALGVAVQKLDMTSWKSEGARENTLAIRGRVVVMDDHWMVLRDAGGQDHWVPMNMILVVDPVSE